MNWSAKGLIAIVALGALSPGVSASVVRYQSVADLSRAASDIVLGVVTARVSFRDFGQIVTHTTVRVTRALKGSGTPRDVVVRQMGGRVGDVASFIEGDPGFRVGEEVVLFLEKRGATHTLLSLSQAKFTVKTDRAGNRFAVRDMRGLVRVPGPLAAQSSALARQVARQGEGSFMLKALLDEVSRATK
ncbi:MAG: hypothetical protein HYY84_05950 [Deltaproteobacteria bacterium]|nr:hypothetical protein [Deltaproteobacteria bacterium]